MPNVKANAPKGAKKPIVVKDAKKESKSELFLRLATPRVEKVLKSLRILGNCGNRNTYEYSQEQIIKMSKKLVEALEQTLKKFHDTKKEQENFEF